MKEIIIISSLIVLSIGSIIYGTKEMIVSSDIYKSTINFITELKEDSNKPRYVEITNYEELLELDKLDSPYIKRSNLNWEYFMDGLDPLEGVPIPDGYKLIATHDSYIQISDNSRSNIILPEANMIDYLKKVFLPEDIELVSHKAYYQGRHRTNGTDSDIGEYTYHSNASNLDYVITFTYNYIEKGEVSTVNNYYSHVTVDKNER